MSEPDKIEPRQTAAAPIKPGIFHRIWDWVFCWRVARFTLISFAVLLTLIAVVWLIEGIRGKRAWNRFKAEMAAAGETLDPKEFMPKAVPDEENFAMTPLLAPLLDYKYTDQPGAHANDWPKVEWRDAEAKKQLDEFYGIQGIYGHRAIPVADRHRRVLTSLGDWQAALRSDTNFHLLSDQVSKEITRETDGGRSEVSYDTNFAATEILLALAQYDSEMNELHAAAKRPYAQFPIHYNEGFATLLPHLNVLRRFGQVAHLKAVALLAEDRPDEALEELLLIVRFTESFRDEPVLISGLVHVALNSQITGLIWEGIARGKWKPRHLAIIEKRLRPIDFFASYRRAIRGERAFAISTLFEYRYNLDMLVGDPSADTQFFRWAPSGVFYQNLVNLGRMYDEYVLEPVDFERRIIDLARAEQADDRVQQTFGKFHPYYICVKAMFPAVNKALQRYAEGQADIDQARLACAIEQYRALNHQLPVSLSDLVPDQLPKLPHDPVNGGSYVYRSNGTDYVIYSLGVDNTDNGGKVEWNEKKPSRRYRDRGDWVWNSSVLSSAPEPAQ